MPLYKDCKISLVILSLREAYMHSNFLSAGENFLCETETTRFDIEELSNNT